MRKEKPLLKDEIKNKIGEAKSLIVASYDKLEPNAAWELRSELSKMDSVLEVVRKRVFLKAAEEAGVKISIDQLKGHVGLFLIDQEDSLPPTKAIFEFSKKNADVLNVLLGFLDGKEVPGKDLEVLSKLPSMNDLRAMMLSLFTAPMSQMLSVVEAKIEEQNGKEEQKS